MFELLLLGGLVLAAGAGLAAFEGATNAAASTPSDSPKVVHYRARDGRNYYSFSIEQQSRGKYRSYIVAQPAYGNRSQDAHSTHRHTDHAGRKYVCWSKPIHSEQDALRVSAAWADATQEYIRSGHRF